MEMVLPITTSSVEAVQVPFDMVQRRVAVPGMVNPVTPEFGDPGEVMVAVPDTTDHCPVPMVGALPARVTEVAPQSPRMSAPALAVVVRLNHPGDSAGRLLLPYKRFLYYNLKG